MSRAYLLVLGEREAIAWVLREQRMAFPATRRADIAALTNHDELFLYATRGAWGNPNRDRGRIIGHAIVASAVRALEEPLEIAGRSFHSGCRLRVDGVVPYPGGVELAPLVGQLATFPKPEAWSIYLRRTLLALHDLDAVLLRERLEPLLMPRAAVLATYHPTSPAAAHQVAGAATHGLGGSHGSPSEPVQHA